MLGEFLEVELGIIRGIKLIKRIKGGGKATDLFGCGIQVCLNPSVEVRQEAK